MELSMSLSPRASDRNRHPSSVNSGKRTMAGVIRGLQNRRFGLNWSKSGFDSHALPPCSIATARRLFGLLVSRTHGRAAA